MIYVIQDGDTLSSICRALFDDALEYHELAAFNGLPNPNKIFVGQVLKLHRSPNMLTHLQKVVNVSPSDETLRRIQNLFRDGFCTIDMAHEIYKAAIK